MTMIQSKQFNWLPRQSTWREMEAWREKQRAHQDQADDVFATSSSLFSNAAVGLATGLAEIAGQIAAERLSKQIDAKVKSELDKLV